MTKKELAKTNDKAEYQLNALDRLVLLEANGDFVNFGNYDRDSIQASAATLIKNGYLRGILVSERKGIWSGLTPFGRFALAEIRKNYSERADNILNLQRGNRII